MQLRTGLGRLAVAVGAAVLVAACTPPSGDAWQQSDESVRGHVILSDTQHSSAMVIAPVGTGGAVIARVEEYLDAVGEPVGGTSKATRLRGSGALRYDVDLGPMTVNAAASAGGRDFFAGWVPESARPWLRSQLLALTPGGVPDSSFGDGGVVTFERPAEPDSLPWGDRPTAVPEAVAVDSAGRVYIALTADSGDDLPSPSFRRDAWVVRLQPDGVIDTDYGVDGAAYLGQIGRFGGGWERRGVVHLAADGSVTVALSAENAVVVFWAEPEGVAVRSVAVAAGSSPIGSDGWRTMVESTGLHRSDGRTLVVVAPDHRLQDPGVVAIDESAVFGAEDGWVDHSELLDESFGDAGVLAWRVEGSYDVPPMTTPVVAVGGIREHADGTFTVPVLTQQGHPGVVSFDAQGRLLRPQLPGGVRVVRTAQEPNLQFGTSNPSGYRGWILAPEEVEFRNGALRSAWSGGWYLAGVEYTEPGGTPQRNGLAMLRIREGAR